MSTIKSWDRPWSMDEMIDNSNNWSLAGDVALLNSLQNFADKLLEKTNQTNDNIENLNNNLEETNLQLNIAQNRFQNLRNTQFIENRIYEDDDDGIVQLEIDDNSNKIEDRDDDHHDDISTAISRGLDILDHYFDKIQVTVSDSDDDDDDNDRISDKDQDVNDLQSVILKPKDFYINRPLPYVIGTDEWHQKWHVGLEDSSDDSDTEKISDNYSESDSESTDLQLIFDRSQIKSSDTSSEFDNNNKQTKQQLTKDDQQSTTTSGSDEIIKQTTTTTNFAQQLAEKLNRVVGNTGRIEEKPEIIPEPEVNTRPIQKLPTKSTNYRDIFFDEPPPLDDIPPVNRHGLFSGGGGLFDDNDDDNDDLWSSKSSKPQPTINDNNTNQTNEQSGLFNDDDDDDDIFKTKEPTKVLPTVFQKSQLPVFNDEPPPVEEPKKPIGGIAIFGGNGLLNQQLLKRRQISDEDTDNDKKTNDETIEEPPQIINDKNDNNDRTVETKKISLFDDDDDNDDLFKDDLFTSNITSKKFTSTLFNDNDDDKNDDLFTEQSNHPDDSIDSLKNDSLELFDDTTPSVSNDDIFNDLPKITEDITSKSSTLKLFDDDDDVNDNDLFKLNIDTHQTNENKQLKKPDTSIFDTTPPILNDNDDDVDDDDFNSSRKFLSQQLFNDDIVDVKPESSKISNRSVIDDQPPKLDDNDDDNHQKIQSPGKLKHNLNINVAALMPGGLPPLKRNDITKIEVRNPEINEISTGFDTTDRVEVLQSVTKARARLPLNRRPSTRRGRKAALETSSKDFKLNNDRIDNKNDIDDVIIIDKKSELFQNDNCDDLFKNHENLKSGNVAKVDDLFGEIQKSEVKKVDTVKTRGLFDDDDDDNNDEDLFTTRKQPVVKQTRLFDDDDDLNDDIFKTTANRSKKPEIKPTTIDRKLSKPSGNIKKLDHSQPDDDPLGILNLNDN